MKERMLSVREVAQRLSAGESSIHVWAAGGGFPGARLERPPVGVPYRLIPDSALEGIVKRHVRRPPKAKRSERKRQILEDIPEAD